MKQSSAAPAAGARFLRFRGLGPSAWLAGIGLAVATDIAVLLIRSRTSGSVVFHAKCSVVTVAVHAGLTRSPAMVVGKCNER